MTDERPSRVIAAIRARYPGARVEFVPCPDPAAALFPFLLIVLDAAREARWEAESRSIDLARAEYPGEPVPFAIVALHPSEVEAWSNPASWADPVEEALPEHR